MGTRHLVTALCVGAAILSGGCRTSDDAGPANRTPASNLLVDATAESGLAGFRHLTGDGGEFWFPETMGGGVALIDYDRDGDLDVAVVAGGTWDGTLLAPIVLYRNLGGLRFEDVTVESGLDSRNAYGMGVAVGDVDGDGWEDLFVTTLQENILYQNRSGEFVDVSAESGLAADRHWSSSAAFFDADIDGDLDLLVGNYVDWTPDKDLWCSNDGTDKTYCTPALYEGAAPSFFLNNGDGTFVDRSTGSGFEASGGKTLGVVVVDYDSDGFIDVAIANDTRADELFVNQGDNTFRDVALASGFAYDERGKARAGMGIDAALDAEGSWSIAVGNFSDEMIGVYGDVGNGTFVDQSAALRVGIASLRTLTFGVLFADVNLDGREDLVAINGHIQPEIGRIRDNVTYAQAPHVFLNEGTAYRDVVPETGVGKPIVGRGLAVGDLDGDGDHDFIASENAGGIYLWKNNAIESGAHFLKVDVSRGRAASRSIGATVAAHAGGRVMEHQVRGGRSYLSASSYEIMLGIDPGASAAGLLDSVRVRWPDGATAVLSDVPIDGEVSVGDSNDN